MYGNLGILGSSAPSDFRVCGSVQRNGVGLRVAAALEDVMSVLPLFLSRSALLHVRVGGLGAAIHLKELWREAACSGQTGGDFGSTSLILSRYVRFQVSREGKGLGAWE